MTPKKKCTNCTEDREYKFFYKNKSTKDGLSSWCISCDSAKSKIYNSSERGKYVRNQKTKTIGRFYAARSQCIKNNLDWLLTKEQYFNIVSRYCTYCKLPYLNETSIGLDRVNLQDGFNINNIIPCCKTCIKIKSKTFTTSEMHQIGDVIRSIKISRLQDFSV